MAGSFSIFHWLIVLVVLLVAYVLPVSFIVKKAGFSPWWSLLSVIPLVGFVALWVFAIVRWPDRSKDALAATG